MKQKEFSIFADFGCRIVWFAVTDRESIAECQKIYKLVLKEVISACRNIGNRTHVIQSIFLKTRLTIATSHHRSIFFKDPTTTVVIEGHKISQVRDQ